MKTYISIMLFIALCCADAFSMEHNSKKRKFIAITTKETNYQYKSEESFKKAIKEEFGSLFFKVLKKGLIPITESVEVKQKRKLYEAFQIVQQLPPELSFPLLLSCIGSQIAIIVKQQLCNLNDKPLEILECFKKAQYLFEEHVTSFLIRIQWINKNSENSLSRISNIICSDSFKKNLSNQFRECIAKRLDSLSEESIISLCEIIIKLPKKEAEEDDNQISVADLFEPWKFIINPLIEKLSNKNRRSDLIIYWATCDDNLEFVKQAFTVNDTIDVIAVENYADDVNETFLWAALKANSFKIAHWLVSENMQISVNDEYGYSPLLFAMNQLVGFDKGSVKKLCKVIIALLNQQPAFSRKKDREIRDAYDKAMSHDSPSVFKAIETKKKFIIGQLINKRMKEFKHSFS